MGVATELLRATTTDGETLHGLLFRPEADELPLDLAVLLIHGVGGNFYSSVVASVGQALAERGFHAAAMNTRGHDWVSTSSGTHRFRGASFEDFEDCLPDIDGQLTMLTDHGYRRFVLFGHSLGAVKVVFYQGTRQRSGVIGVVACSGPRQFYSSRLVEQEDFPEKITEAQQMLDDGRGEEFLYAQTGTSIGLFSARTFVSKYGPHERNDVRPHAARLGCPILTTAGGDEAPAYTRHAHELAEAAGMLGTCYIVPGANHTYDGHRGELFDVAERWLAPITQGS